MKVQICLVTVLVKVDWLSSYQNICAHLAENGTFVPVAPGVTRSVVLSVVIAVVEYFHRNSSLGTDFLLSHYS